MPDDTCVACAGPAPKCVAMAAENNGRYILDRNLEFLSDESPEAGGIQNPSHTNDTILREFRDHVRNLRHGIQRIGDNDDYGLG